MLFKKYQKLTKEEQKVLEEFHRQKLADKIIEDKVTQFNDLLQEIHDLGYSVLVERDGKYTFNWKAVNNVSLNKAEKEILITQDILKPIHKPYCTKEE